MNNLERIEKIEKELAELKAECVVKPNKRWRAEVGFDYFWINSNGRIVTDAEGATTFDAYTWLTGNYFQSQEEAEHYKAVQLATQKIKDTLLEKQGDWLTDWSDNQQYKYYCFYNHYLKSFDISFNDSVQVLGTPYSTSQAWQYVIDNLQDELKLVYGVE